MAILFLLYDLHIIPQGSLQHLCDNSNNKYDLVFYNT